MKNRNQTDRLPILSRVRDSLVRIYGRRLKRLIVYGSWARGEQRRDSDLDILVVLDGFTSRYEEIKKINGAIQPLCLEQNLVISAFPLSEEYLRRYGKTAFIQNVMEDAVTL